ncbi:MAG TPA: malto-oligosyltrehalose synthase [Gemmatimonadaceae bacterium]|nr:malto-oligosyltrehalose synthase [Gemmatimonadaceae bacterium]
MSALPFAAASAASPNTRPGAPRSDTPRSDTPRSAAPRSDAPSSDAPALRPPRPLRATCRIQMSAEMPFARVRELVPYLERLGISHLYSSPILMARRGSTHGYDVADPTRLDPALGARDEFRAAVQALHDRGMGWLLDIVPNHMGVGRDNPFWMDVLRRGRHSAYAGWFDIDWDPIRRPLRGRVLLPLLGDSLERVLARGELSIVEEDGELLLAYADRRFPLSPESEDKVRAAVPGDARAAARTFTEGSEGRDRLRALLRRQAYRLAYWRRAERELNYRRFFNINELVALRMEDPAVFADTHALVLHFVSEGALDGLRVDHVDGLADPRGYLERLRAATRSAGAPAEMPIVVEKILAARERLPREWPVQGTTGYEFLNELESVFVDPAGAARIESAYRRVTRTRVSFREIGIRAKLLVLSHSLLADVRRLRRLLGPLAAEQGAPAARGAALTRAVETLIACLPVYRTYIDARDAPRKADREVVHDAARQAEARRGIDPGVISWLAALIVESPRASWSHGERADAEAARAHDDARLRFVTRVQQTSGPAAAKGIEDTALYRYVPLASLNEVGGDPARDLHHAVADFHAACDERARHWPDTLLAGTTHDTKHSADTRARLDVLSEIPDRWLRQVSAWRRAHRPFRTRVAGRTVPDAATEYLIYQTVIGIWPPLVPGASLPSHEHADILQRTRDYLRKAGREAKVHTSWGRPNEGWEGAVDRFICALLERPDTPFARQVSTLVSELAPAGMRNALARVVVHATTPGVPDLYQGDELWSFTLVDPDNRRPVDFALRQRLLAELEARASAAEGSDDAVRALVGELVAHPEDGRVKLWITWRSLQARRAHAELFARGEYVPLAAAGGAAASVLAFARRLEGATAITAVPRLTAHVPDPLSAAFSRTAIPLPDGWGDTWRCELSGRTVTAAGGALPADALFGHLPAALLFPVP